MYKMNVREHIRDNQKWTIQRKLQHRVHKTKKQNTKKKPTQFMDTTMGKHTSIT